MKKLSKLNEDIGKTGDNFIGFGVKDDFKVNKNDGKKGIINPYTKIVEEDKKTLSQISETLLNQINSLTEMYQFLDNYGKINPDIIQTVINQLKTYQEAISKEIEQLK